MVLLFVICERARGVFGVDKVDDRDAMRGSLGECLGM